MTYAVYDYYEEEVGFADDIAEARRLVASNRLDGYSIWEGDLDDGEFVPRQRVEHCEQSSDDPRINEAMGRYVQDDTGQLEEPWWRTP